MSSKFLIAGAGIAGLSTALALARQGHTVTLLEQAAALSEVGAGIQLGPNAMRILQGWDLGDAIRNAGCEPTALMVRDARNDQLLTTRRLDDAQDRYGAPYVTIRRAAVQNILLQAALDAGATLELGQKFDALSHANVDSNFDVILGCDGLHSRVREHMLGGTRHGGKPRATGHTAYRSMLPQSCCPISFHSDHVQVWLDTAQHVVTYSVRGNAGEWLLNVVIAQSKPPDLSDIQSPLLRKLVERVQANGGFSEWPLFDRAPLLSASHYLHGDVHGTLALLGDAAHPMRPYLAQGAAMAMEDAWALAQAMGREANIHEALQTYAQVRWKRNAAVQIRSQLQGYAFHASGLTRVARNWALKAFGERITSMPWLHGFPLSPE